MDVGVYTYGAKIPLPSFGTDLASCFDLAYQNVKPYAIGGYDAENKPIIVNTDYEINFFFPPGVRLLIPTGMIFDLPEGHDMRIHPRSGVSYRQGLTLINCEGVVDEDYTQELYLPMINLSSRSVLITQGMRLAQAEICAARPSYQVGELAWRSAYRLPRPNFVRLDNPPADKTNRTGGFGSTGTN